MSILPLTIPGPATAPRFLFLGAHCDDIEIGCGATILALVARYPDAEFHWVTFASDAVREQETRRCAERLLGKDVTRSCSVHTYRESHFPSQVPELKAEIESIKARVRPDVVFTHHRDDRHQDHATLSDLTWNSFRDHLVLEYEIPKFDGDLGQPNFFVPVTREHVDLKIRILLEEFASQRDRYWFTDETFLAMLRLRGVEARSSTGYAEGFYARKVHFGLLDR